MAPLHALLDNPFWSALTTRHRAIALGEGRVRRYPSAVAPFAAVSEPTDEALQELESLIQPGEAVGLLGVVPLGLKSWTIRRKFDIWQYTYDRPAPALDDPHITRLGEDDLDAMLELAALVYPAYFRRETVALGPYFGVKLKGRLCAMAGIRMAVEGGQEISAVCTHPDFRGQGLAGRLTHHAVLHIQAQGDTPYLHTEEDNGAAQSIYERLGFVRRAVLPFWVADPQSPLVHRNNGAA